MLLLETELENIKFMKELSSLESVRLPGQVCAEGGQLGVGGVWANRFCLC